MENKDSGKKARKYGAQISVAIMILGGVLQKAEIMENRVFGGVALLAFIFLLLFTLVRVFKGDFKPEKGSIWEGL